MNDGWSGASKPRKTIEDKERKLSETPDLVIGSGRGTAKYKMDLIPPNLIVARYFRDEQAKLDELNLAVEVASRAVQEYIEEHAVEGGLLEEAADDNGKVTKAGATKRLKLARFEKAEQEEIQALQHVIDLFNTDSIAKATAKETQDALDTDSLKQYGELTENDVKTLVVDEKWAATVQGCILSEVNALTHALVSRIQELSDRYAETTAKLHGDFAKFETRVTRHLAAMGIK
jgi:type I restriction enzyme M protein